MRILVAATMDSAHGWAMAQGWKPLGRQRFQDADGHPVVIRQFHKNMFRGVRGVLVYVGPGVYITEEMRRGRDLTVVRIELSNGHTEGTL